MGEDDSRAAVREAAHAPATGNSVPLHPQHLCCAQDGVSVSIFPFKFALAAPQGCPAAPAQLLQPHIACPCTDPHHGLQWKGDKLARGAQLWGCGLTKPTIMGQTLPGNTPAGWSEEKTPPRKGHPSVGQGMLLPVLGCFPLNPPEQQSSAVLCLFTQSLQTQLAAQESKKTHPSNKFL